MEESSQDEDPDEALRGYYAKMRERNKKREEKKKRGKRSVSGEAESADKEGQDMHEGNTLDHTKLTALTSADEDKHISPTSEGIPSSPHYISRLGLQTSEDNLDDDDLLDFNDFTSETASPRPLGQASQDEDIAMEIGASPNQAEGLEQATSTQENNSNLPDEASSGSQIQPTRGHHFTCASARNHFTCTSARKHFNSHG
jgi:hypothetical protein